MKFLIRSLLLLSSVTTVYASEKIESTSCTDELALQSTESSEKFLTSMLNPITTEDFFENHFQKKAASAQRPGMPTFYGPMVSFEDVEYAIEYGHKVSNPNQRLVYGKDWKLAKRVFRDDDYWTGLYKSDSGEMSVEEAMKAVSMGFTVIMNGVQSSMPNVYQSAWQLETALGWHVNVNLYISPQGGSQGFEAHLDWMDGFIFQITGQKRWKVYEPALVSYPRPDMVRKPPMSFVETDAVESDLMMRAGDFAYIPRGQVHQAHTSKDDLGGPADHPYQLASMHLTFGLELAKDASVEMLMHHFVSKLPPSGFATLSQSISQDVSSQQSFEFKSDDGVVSFECESSFEFSSEVSPSSCSVRDIVHLMLAAMAGYISEDEEAFFNDSAYLESNEEVLSTSLLRKAVGLTRRTARMQSLDPRRLLPEGVKVFSRAIKELGVKQLIQFLLDKDMIFLTSVPSCETDLQGECSSDIAAERLNPASASTRSYTTLGSDFTCDYLDGFFSKSFKREGAKRLGLQILVSNESLWEQMVTEDDVPALGTVGRAYDREAVLRYLSEHSWQQLDHTLGNFVDEVFHGALLPSEDSAGTKKKKRKKRYDESSVYCAAWNGMMDAISMDKSVRKKSGHAALQNAGYQMNAN